MPSPSKYLLAGLASLALVACGTDRQESPLAPTSASLSATPSCSNFSFIRNDAKAYFASTKDPVYVAITALESAQGNIDANVTKNAALGVLSNVAGAAKDASRRKSTATASTGNTLVQDVFLCSTYSGYPTDLTTSLGADGLFEVLGTTADEPTTTGKYVVSHGTFKYGAQPQTGNTWAGSTSSTRFLLYGYLRSTTGFTLESLVPNTSAFELTAFPTVTFNPKIVAGACTPGNTGYPVQHKGSILPNVALDFCPTTGAMAPQTSTGFFATLASWITPQSLNAAAASSESAGGLISGLSPFAPVLVNSASVVFTIKQVVGTDTTNFTNKNVFDPFDVVVTLTSTKGTPLADIEVTALISGNSGSFTQPTPTTATTNADGVAVFSNWSIDKAGGYTISASAPVLGAGLSVSSNLFNVKNK